jgi:hypothetical protein
MRTKDEVLEDMIQCYADLTHAISFSSVLIGLAGFIVLSPAMYAYIKWFDNMFGK